MPEFDLSESIPPNARWLKIQFKMKALKPGADLTARLWSGVLDDAVTIKGDAGEAFVKLQKPQHLSYQKPRDVELKLKVIAYKVIEDNGG